MAIVLDIVSLTAIIASYVLSIRALPHRTDKNLTFPSWNPKYWLPIWMMKQYFTPKGYRLFMWGSVLLLFGLVLQVIQYWPK
ncbi:MAG: hypothetical protein PHR28_02090 [candidate division Zixibacteria bacterium]|nr:hypothetical protein [candidate division Zixibacteria bacterium]